MGLNALLGSPLRTERLIELGARVGSDIPFCIQGGTAMVRGYGEILEALEPLDDCRILIAKPAKGVPTAECFARYDASGKPYGIPGTPLIKKAINADDLSAVCKLLYNALEEAADLPGGAGDPADHAGIGRSRKPDDRFRVCGIRDLPPQRTAGKRLPHSEKAGLLYPPVQSGGIWRHHH